MKQILLLTTGGTIASIPSEKGLSPGISAHELTQYLSQGRPNYTVHSQSLMNIDSTNMQPEDWVTIAQSVYEHLDTYDGFVISHGTDTMAYTAAAVSYMLQNLGKPVVFTGSQIPFNYRKTDAKRNLRDAVRFACEDVGGVYVVFNGRVIAGTRAVKLRTKSYDAFESINYPYVASIDGPDVRYNVKPSGPTGAKRRKVDFKPSLCTDVLLLKLYPGIHPQVFDGLSHRFKGLVIESFGNGGIPILKRNLVPKIEALVDAGVAVVVTTQCLQEGEDLSLYEVGRRVAENGKVILSKDMNTEAIIPKLMWVLGQYDTIADVKKWMETPVALDCSF